jgi:peroxiredoxin
MEAHRDAPDVVAGTTNADTAGVPSDHTTLSEVLGQFADAGFVGQFEVAGGGTTLRCLTCQGETGASDLPDHTIRRLEGASDPADMAAVVAVTCPRCGAGGTLVLPFGPSASASEALVLAELRDARGDSVTPRRSAPGETIGDGGPASGHDALPGESAPAFSASSSTGRELSLDAFLGKVPVALTFAGTLSPEATAELVDSFEQSFPELGRHHVQSLVVVPEPAETIRRRRRTGTKVPLIADDTGRLVEMYAASATFPATVLIDENGTITRLVEGGVAADHAAAVLAFAEDVHHGAHR